MATPVLVIGHKNPDNDSISAAIGYAYLKNELMKRQLAVDPTAEELEYLPARLGPLPEESQSILDQYGIDVPQAVAHVHARVSDVMSSPVISISKDEPLWRAGRMLRKYNIRALVVTDEDGKYAGLISTRMIAERYIAATDIEKTADGRVDTLQIANDLISSLQQPVAELTEHEVLELNPKGLLKEAITDLMASDLREAVVLDKEGYAIGVVTRSDIATNPKRKVVLVDHNEKSQAVNGVSEAEVLEIIDHHRIGDISTVNPIRFINLPVGSTATIVTMQFREHGVPIPKGIAAVLLSAIMTDTIITKSPTTTETDHEQIAYLSEIVGVDPTEFGLMVFKCRASDAEIDTETLITADSKEFQIGDETILIAQHETVTLDVVLEREEEIREYLRGLVKNKGYDYVLLLVTDIFAEGSSFIVEGDHHTIDHEFGIDTSTAVWVPGILSRKKQVAARLLGA